MGCEDGLREGGVPWGAWRRGQRWQGVPWGACLGGLALRLLLALDLDRRLEREELCEDVRRDVGADGFSADRSSSSTSSSFSHQLAMVETSTTRPITLVCPPTTSLTLRPTFLLLL